MIGPSSSNHTRLYDLFTDNGIVQGVFIENKTFHYIQHPIQTEKFIWEKQYGKRSNHLVWTLFHKFFHQLGFLPNLEGTANTSLMKLDSKILALFERDVPYQLDLCFKTKTLSTLGRLGLHKIRYFSAHSKQIGDYVYTAEYDFIQKKVKFHQISLSLDQLYRSYTISTTYIPILHDFIIHNDSILFLDSPFEYSFSELCKGRFPIHLNSQKPSYFIQVDLHTGNLQRYVYPHGICIFHYSKCIDWKHQMIIYAPIYETLNFNHLQNEAHYQKISLDKRISKVQIDTNPYLNQFNVDFPIQYGDWTILRHLNHQEQRIDRLLICKDLELIHALTYQNHSLCGEPIIIPSDRFDLLLVCTNSSLFITRLDTFQSEEISLNTTVQLSFHSLWIPFSSE